MKYFGDDRRPRVELLMAAGCHDGSTSHTVRHIPPYPEHNIKQEARITTYLSSGDKVQAYYYIYMHICS